MAAELAVASAVALFATSALQATPIRVAAHVLLALPVLVVWLSHGLWKPIPLLGPMSVGLGLYVVSAVMSDAPRTGLETAGIPALLIAVYGLAYLGAAHPRVRQGVAVAVSLASTAWLTAIAVRWTWEKVEWTLLTGTVPATEPLTHFVWLVTNAVPMLALLSAPFVISLGRGPARLVTGAVFAVASVIVIALSSGFIAIAGIAVACVAFAAMSTPRHRWWLATVTMIMVLAMVAVPIGLVAMPDLAPAPLEARARLWEQAAAMARDAPFLGTGPGTFGVRRLEYVAPFASPILATQAHSTVLQLVAEGGLVLLAAWLALGATFARHLWRGRRLLQPWHRIALASLAGLGATLAIESFQELMAFWILAAILISWIVSDTTTQRQGASRKPIKLALIGLTLLPMPFVVLADIARVNFEAGRTAWTQGTDGEAAASFDAAATLEPENAAHSLALGLVQAESNNDDAAERAYARAAYLNPRDARALGGLAVVTDGPTKRLTLLSEATERAEDDPQYAWRWAAELERADRRTEAVTAHAHAIIHEPLWLEEITDDLLREDIASHARLMLREVGDAARLNADAVMWDIGLVMGQLPPTAPAAWKAVDSYLRGDEAEAQRLAREAIRTAPNDARSWQSFAAVAPCSSPDRHRAFEAERRTPNSYWRTSTLVWRHGERFYGVAPLVDYQPPSAEAPPLKMWPFTLVERDCDERT